MTAWILTPLESGLLYLALGAYGGASFVGIRVVGGDRRSRSLQPMLLAGAIALTALLLVLAVRQGQVPFGQRHEALLASAWTLGVGALWVGRRPGLPML